MTSDTPIKSNANGNKISLLVYILQSKYTPNDVLMSLDFYVHCVIIFYFIFLLTWVSDSERDMILKSLQFASQDSSSSLTFIFCNNLK